MNASFSELIGHGRQMAYLKTLLSTGRVPHALAFIGPESVGKSAVAKALFAELAGQVIDAYPDFLSVERRYDEKKEAFAQTISIEQIRAVTERLSHSSFTGGKKLVLIEDAHRMTPAAQNALLKTLEEPRGDAVLVLVASDEAKLLPTIRSRCHVIRFGLVAREELCEALTPEFQKERAHVLAGFAAGRPGVARRISGELETFQASLAEAYTFFTAPTWTQFGMIEALVKQGTREDLASTLRLWRVVAHDALLSSSGLRHSAADQDSDVLKSVAKHKSPYEWLEILKALCDAEALIQTNVSPQLALEHATLSSTHV